MAAGVVTPVESGGVGVGSATCTVVAFDAAAAFTASDAAGVDSPVPGTAEIWVGVGDVDGTVARASWVGVVAGGVVEAS
jgi:hypothetical protein